MLSTLLAGCGTPAAESSTDSSSQASSSQASSSEASSEAESGTGSGELSISWWGGDSRHAATQEAVKAFTAETGVEVKTTYGAWTGWEDSMSTSFYAGSAPDVNQINWNWIYLYDTGDTFADLNEYSDIIDLTQYSEEALAQCTVDGKLKIMPVSMTGRIFYWNEKPFADAGLSAPTTYDELMAAGPVFQEKLGDDFYPLVMNELDRTIFMVWALECKYGKNWIEDGELQYTKEEIAEGMQMLLDMEEAHVIPTMQKLLGDGAESLDKNPKWIDGKYGGIFEWDSSAAKFKGALADEGESFVVGDYLTGFGEFKGGFTKVSLGFAISETCEDKETAAKMINFMLNEDEGVRAMGGERGVPLSKKALELCEAEGLLNALTAEANAKVLDWCSFELDPTFEDAKLKSSDGVYFDVMSGVSYGDYTVDEGADILISGIEDTIASFGK